MNKDVVGLVYCLLYRLKFDDVVEEYRKTFESSSWVNDGRIFYVPAGWYLNYRNVYNPCNYYDTTIVNFIKLIQIQIKRRKY